MKKFRIFSKKLSYLNNILIKTNFIIISNCIENILYVEYNSFVIYIKLKNNEKIMIFSIDDSLYQVKIKNKGKAKQNLNEN